MNISSIVIRIAPEHMAQVAKSLREIETCDVHFSDESGRFVVTVEGTDDADETAKLKLIQALPGVLSADFSYTYNDDGTDPAES